MKIKDIVEKLSNAKLDKRSLSGDTKSFRYTSGGDRLPTGNTASAKDITKKFKQTDMPDGSYKIGFDYLDKEKLKKVVAKLIPTLGNKKNEMVLRARFGLEPFEKEYTLKQIAAALEVTPEVIRQREAKALRQLKHISRSRELIPFLHEEIDQESIDKFHNELDKLVHRYLGHSSDEEKEKAALKKGKKTAAEESIMMTEEQFDEAAGEKDACYHKVKSRYKVWPSAYASGALVQCRKAGAANWGNKSK